MSILEKFRKYRTIGTIALVLSTASCAITPKYKILKSADYLDNSKWKEVENVKIYEETYTSVMGLLGKITIEDGVNVPVKTYLNAVDMNNDGYITPRELSEFKKERGF